MKYKLNYVFKMILIVVVTICLSGCFNKTISTTISEEEYLNSLVIPNQDNIEEDFWLHKYHEITDLKWNSSNDNIINVDGNFAKVNKNKETYNITLTATTQNGYSRDFDFIVRGHNDETDIYNDIQFIKYEYYQFIFSDTELPTLGPNGSSINWKTDNKFVEIVDNVLIKQSDEEKLNIKLDVELSKNGYSDSVQIELVLLDEFGGYIMSYFNGETEKESGKFAYSYDGLHWTDLNEGEPILESILGTKRVRDPYIGRNRDGEFIILATQGFDNPDIYYWESTDLIELNDHRLIKVAKYDEKIQSSGERAWAPQFYYDIDDDIYYIYYSDPKISSMNNEGNILAIKTKDFSEFSDPFIMYGPGYKVIDGTIVHNGGNRWIIYKDEREGAKTIYTAKLFELDNDSEITYDDKYIFNQRYIEGPFVVDDPYSTKNYLYVDHFPKEKFYVAEYTTLGKNNDIRWLDESEYTLPNSDVRHGSSIPVTKKELNRLIQHYK